MPQSTEQKGFALPLAIGVGLVMIAIAIIMVIRSNQNRITSISQSSTYTSLSAAETGVSKVQALLNTYREFATSDSDCASNPDCWTNLRTELRGRLGCGTYTGTDFSNALINRQWINIDAVAPQKGFYRLENYAYNDALNRGTMIVEGADRVAGQTPEGGVTRLTVDIPVVIDGTPGPMLPNQGSPLPSPAPTTAPQILRPCSYAEIPPPPPAEFDITAAITSSGTLPRSGDISPGKQTYVYRLATPATYGIDLPSNQTLSITPANGADTTVILLADNNIRLNGGLIDIQSNARLIVFARNSIEAIQPTGTLSLQPPFVNNDALPLSLQFFLTGTDLNPNTQGGPVGELNLQSTSPRPVHFVAYGPNATVALNGVSASSGHFTGAVWANRFWLISPANSFSQVPIPEASNHPSPWSGARNISTLFHQLQPVNSWRQEQR